MQMNTPAELNDRRFSMGWTQQQQRNFPLAPPQNLMGFPAATAGRPEFNSFGMLGNSMAGSSSAGLNQIGESNFIGNSSVRLPFFKCPECNIIKNSGEDLEAFSLIFFDLLRNLGAHEDGTSELAAFHLSTLSCRKGFRHPNARAHVFFPQKE